MGEVSVRGAGVVAISRCLSVWLAGSLVCLGRTLASAQLPLTPCGFQLARLPPGAGGSPVPLAASCPWHHSLCCSLHCGVLREEPLQTCTSSAPPHLPLPRAASGTHSPLPVSLPRPTAHFFNSRPGHSRVSYAGHRAILRLSQSQGIKQGLIWDCTVLAGSHYIAEILVFFCVFSPQISEESRLHPTT